MLNEVPVGVLTSMPQTLDKPKLLIGEGKDELRFFTSLLSYLKITDVKVEEYGGKSKLPGYLNALVKRPEFLKLTSLGVTRDADKNALGAFESIRNNLLRLNLVAPQECGRIEVGQPNVGVLLFPEGLAEGMLEDLFLQTLTSHPILNCINDYVACVKASPAPTPRELSKARVHAWLAMQEPPDLQLGTAAQKGLINWDAPSYQSLRAFVLGL